MISTIKKFVNIGVRIAEVTKREVETELEVLIKENKITAEDAKELVNDIMKEAIHEKRRLAALFEKKKEKVAPMIAATKRSAKRVASKVGKEAAKQIKPLAKKAAASAKKEAAILKRKANVLKRKAVAAAGKVKRRFRKNK
jgi:polyhydroxyalkanoate synthesis regulator phasin